MNRGTKLRPCLFLVKPAELSNINRVSTLLGIALVLLCDRTTEKTRTTLQFSHCD